MSILIKGMEMPKDRPQLLWVYPNGKALTVQSDVDPWKELQAVPVPPHERLIDADKMKKSIRKQTAFLRLIGGEFAEIAETLEKGFLQEIDNAPTIIPAEEGE